MFERGECKVPLEKIPALAKALGVDPAHLFRLGFEVHWPNLAGVIEDVFDRQLASKNETEILLKRRRTATDDADPAANAKLQAIVDKTFEEITLLLAS